jgi:hypothetical protein
LGIALSGDCLALFCIGFDVEQDDGILSRDLRNIPSDQQHI